jgi:hypothetical protein
MTSADVPSTPASASPGSASCRTRALDQRPLNCCPHARQWGSSACCRTVTCWPRSAPRATSRLTPCCRAGRRNAGDRAPGQLLAERVTALGGIAEGTLEAAAGHSALPSYPVEIVPEREHVDALSTALAVFGKAAREAIEGAARFGDADTADVFTEISRETDKQLWLVESHLHG